MSADEPPPTAAEALGEIARVIAWLASRGMSADRAVAVLLCMAAKVAKWSHGGGYQGEFVNAARRCYRATEVRDGD